MMTTTIRLFLINFDVGPTLYKCYTNVLWSLGWLYVWLSVFVALCFQVIKMLVLVIVLFALCWGPMLVDNVLTAFSVTRRQSQGHLRYLRLTFSLLAYFNSCVNPVVYAFMSKNFRQSFAGAVPCCWWCFRDRTERASSFTTRNSTVSLTHTACTPNHKYYEADGYTSTEVHAVDQVSPAVRGSVKPPGPACPSYRRKLLSEQHHADSTEDRDTDTETAL